jgi:hypothetical protein
MKGRAMRKLFWFLAALLLTLPWAPFAAAQQQLQTMTSGGFTYELNTDRLGGDYIDYELKTQSPESCHALCEADKNCKAFTYTRPNFQGDHPRCWLKAVVPPTSKNFCCTSGVMNR